MKKFFIFALLLIVNCQLSIVNCQTMNVHVGNVCTLVPADSVGTMPYSGGSTVTIAGYTYNTADIDQITIDNTTVEAYTVKVVYSEGAAQIYCSADARPYLTFSTSGAYVSVTADASLADEITYVLSGSASDGQFLQSGSYKCTVELNGLTLSSASSAPILIDNGKRIRLRLTDGTTSTLADGATGTKKPASTPKDTSNSEAAAHSTSPATPPTPSSPKNTPTWAKASAPSTCSAPPTTACTSANTSK